MLQPANNMQVNATSKQRTVIDAGESEWDMFFMAGNNRVFTELRELEKPSPE